MITYTNRQINSGAQVRKARQRSTMGKIHRCDVRVRPCALPYSLSGWRWGGTTASGDGSVTAIFVVIIIIAALRSVHRN